MGKTALRNRFAHTSTGNPKDDSTAPASGTDYSVRKTDMSGQVSKHYICSRLYCNLGTDPGSLVYAEIAIVNVMLASGNLCGGALRR